MSEASENERRSQVQAADFGSVGPLSMAVVHDAPGQPVALVIYSGGPPRTIALRPSQALDLARRLLDAALARMAV